VPRQDLNLLRSIRQHYRYGLRSSRPLLISIDAVRHPESRLTVRVPLLGVEPEPGAERGGQAAGRPPTPSSAKRSSGKDAVTRVSTARTRGFAHTARLVDFAISADGSLAVRLVGRKRHHGAGD